MVGAAILLLAVVSTLVAFNGWPGAGLARDVGSLVVREPAASVRVEGPAQLAADALPSARDVAATAAPGSAAATPAGAGAAAAPAVAPVTVTPSVGGPGGVVNTPPRAVSNGPVVPVAPVQPRPVAAGLPPLLPDNPAGRGVAGVTNTLGDTTQGLTGALGNTVGLLSPGLGNTVTQLGVGLSDLLRSLGQTR
jgi:hypothetical protein